MLSPCGSTRPCRPPLLSSLTLSSDPLFPIPDQARRRRGADDRVHPARHLLGRLPPVTVSCTFFFGEQKGAGPRVGRTGGPAGPIPSPLRPLMTSHAPPTPTLSLSLSPANSRRAPPPACARKSASPPPAPPSWAACWAGGGRPSWGAARCRWSGPSRRALTGWPWCCGAGCVFLVGERECGGGGACVCACERGAAPPAHTKRRALTKPPFSSFSPPPFSTHSRAPPGAPSAWSSASCWARRGGRPRPAP